MEHIKTEDAGTYAVGRARYCPACARPLIPLDDAVAGGQYEDLNAALIDEEARCSCCDRPWTACPCTPPTGDCQAIIKDDTRSWRFLTNDECVKISYDPAALNALKATPLRFVNYDGSVVNIRFSHFTRPTLGNHERVTLHVYADNGVKTILEPREVQIEAD